MVYPCSYPWSVHGPIEVQDSDPRRRGTSHADDVGYFMVTCIHDYEYVINVYIYIYYRYISGD